MNKANCAWSAAVLCLTVLACGEPPAASDGGPLFDAMVAGDVATDDATATDHSQPGDAGPGVDSARPDAARSDATRPDGARPDSARSDAARPDAGDDPGVEINAGWIGGACATPAQCNDPNFASALCETQDFPSGMCTQACSLSSTSGNWICPDSSGALITTTRCIETATGDPRCVSECDFDLSPTGCRPGYACVLSERYNQPASVFAVCLPAASQAWPGTSTPGFDIGGACGDDNACGHLACINWPSGYCTKTMCEYAGCPTGSHCYEVAGLGVCGSSNADSCTVCLKDCVGDDDCRNGSGYTCDQEIDACWPAPTETCQPIPDEAGFNFYTVQALNDTLLFPTDNTYPFCWLSSSCGSSRGAIHDSHYGGQLIMSGGSDCFCTGYTLEIFLDAWRRYRQDNGLASNALFGDLSVSRLNGGDFYQQWQGTGSAPNPNIASSAEAFELVDIGYAIGESGWETVRAGDFVNLSRDPASGHAVVFVNWVRNSSDRIIGFRYYGCNPGGGDKCPNPDDPANESYINGPGFITELFYGLGGEVVPRYLFIGRVQEP